MADNLTDTAENRTLDWLTGNATTAPVLPLRLALLTANGSDTAAGTEVNGSAYTRKDVTFGVAAGGTTSNTTAVTWTSLDPANAFTVVGVEVWDSAATPVRWWHGALGVTKTVAAGDSCEFAAGDLDLTLG